MRNVQSRGQFCAEQGKDVVPFRTIKRQQICALWTPSSRVHLIVGSSEHDQLGKKLQHSTGVKSGLKCPLHL